MRNPFRVGTTFVDITPGFSLRSNPGLRLANAFGVNDEPRLANAFGVNDELRLANAFGVRNS